MMKSAFFGGMREREARSRTLKQTLRLCKFEVKRANHILVVSKISHNIK